MNGNSLKVWFDFGKNWQDFSEDIAQENYTEAKESLKRLLPDIENKTFLDMGCGSGLFSAAASSLGAKEVIGFDIDPISVSVSQRNLEKLVFWDDDIKKDRVRFFAGSILNGVGHDEAYDVVYSWGVLHHTGNMRKAFDNASSFVKPGGLLVISIYNRHFTSFFWKCIKYIYNISPGPIKKLLVFFFCPLIYMAKLVTTRKNPIKSRRGMNFFRNVVDWIGGFPYEYASISEVTGYFEELGFSTEKVIKAEVPTGCNEFIFRKKG